jgi:hypothetical protein
VSRRDDSTLDLKGIGWEWCVLNSVDSPVTLVMRIWVPQNGENLTVSLSRSVLLHEINYAKRILKKAAKTEMNIKMEGRQL